MTIKKRETNKKKTLLRPRGQALVLTTVFIAVLLTFSMAIVQRSANVSLESRGVNQKIAARALAEAGVEKAIYCLNQSDGTNCGGTFGASYVGENNVSLGNGTFSTTITSIDAQTKSITSTGYIPNSTRPLNTVTIKTQATINADVVTFNYGVQAGIGGIEMHKSAQIIGNIYVNGDVVGDGGQTPPQITGDVDVAGGMAVTADQSDTVQNADYIFGKTSSQMDIAQSFRVSIDNQINKVSFYIKKYGSPSDVTVRILADNNGVPSKTVLASKSLESYHVTATYGWVDVFFHDPPPVFAGITYWASIDVGSPYTTKYWILGLDNQNGYASGTSTVSANWYASPPVWSAITGSDFDFKVWLGGEATKIDGIAVGNDVHAHEIRHTDVGRDAYANIIHEDSTIHRDARAALINDCVVIRDAYANSTTGTTVGGYTYPGEAQPDPAPTDMPISASQIQEWKDIATAGGSTGSISLIKDQKLTLGPKKVEGDVNLSKNGSELELTGPVLVTGNLTLANGGKIDVDPSLGAQGTVIIVSGKIIVDNFSQIEGNGTTGSYLLAISEYTGTTDDDPAVSMSNNTATGVLYAPYGAVYVPNSAQLKEITAYKLILTNAAVVNYEKGLAHATFSTGPGGSWILKKGTWQEL